MGGLALFDRERAQIEAAYAWQDGRDDEDAARQMIAIINAVTYLRSCEKSHGSFDLASLRVRR